MGLVLEYNDGQTPLDEDEKDGLLVSSITTRAELDEWEQANIEAAMLWIAKRRKSFSADEVLDETFITMLHKRMYGDVWKWAGSYRRTGKNIGVMPYEITVSLRQLIDDCKMWIAQKVYADDEIALRFKHRIVQIHCFPNGNGRHSRLLADLMTEKLFGKEVFSWGMKKYNSAEARIKYLQVLRDADSNNYTALLNFARS